MKEKEGRVHTQIKKRVVIFWVCITALIFTAAVVIASMGTFSRTDKKVSHVLEMNLDNISQSIQSCMDKLTAQSLIMSENISREIEMLLLNEGMEFDDLNDNLELLTKLQDNIYDHVNTALRIGDCSGAYVVLDATANTNLAKSDIMRSGLYLRRVNITGTSSANPDVKMFRGIPQTARNKNTELHNRWNPEFDTSLLPGYQDMMESRIGRPAELYYWTEKIHLQDTWEEALLLCVPVLGENNRIYGVCGVDISSLFFYHYAPVTQTEFGPAATVLAPLENGKLMSQKGLTGGVSGTYLEDAENMTIHQEAYFSGFLSEKSRYIGVMQPVNIALEDGQYRQWVSALIMPDEYYKDYAIHESIKMLLSVMVILAAAAGLSLMLYMKLLHPVVKDLEKNEYTDMDRLIEFVQNNSVNSVFDYSQIPDDIVCMMKNFYRGICELDEDEKEIFREFVKGGNPLDGLKSGSISSNKMRRKVNIICQKLEVNSPDDIMLYLDFINRCGRLQSFKDI